MMPGENPARSSAACQETDSCNLVGSRTESFDALATEGSLPVDFGLLAGSCFGREAPNIAWPFAGRDDHTDHETVIINTRNIENPRNTVQPPDSVRASTFNNIGKHKGRR